MRDESSYAGDNLSARETPITKTTKAINGIDHNILEGISGRR